MRRLLIAVSLLLGGAMFSAGPASAHTCVIDGQVFTLRPFNLGDTHVQICHGTGSDSHPFEIIDPNVAGACHHLVEHQADAQSTDVFPDNFLANTATLCK
jgi:hypothetical protein